MKIKLNVSRDKTIVNRKPHQAYPFFGNFEMESMKNILSKYQRYPFFSKILLIHNPLLITFTVLFFLYLRFFLAQFFFKEFPNEKIFSQRERILSNKQRLHQPAGSEATISIQHQRTSNFSNSREKLAHPFSAQPNSTLLVTKKLHRNCFFFFLNIFFKIT